MPQPQSSCELLQTGVGFTCDLPVVYFVQILMNVLLESVQTLLGQFVPTLLDRLSVTAGLASGSLGMVVHVKVCT